MKKGQNEEITAGSFEGKLDQKKKFVELRAKGFSIRKIARKLRHSPQTCLNWQAELEDEIARLKAIELEALYEKYHLLKEHRIELLGSQIEAIRRELKNRDLGELSTEKLLDLQLRYIDEACKEYVEPKLIPAGTIGDFGNKNRAKLDSEDVTFELAMVLLKYRKGLISDAQAKQEISLLQAILKAEDQVDLQKKLEKLETLLGGRK